MVFVFLYLPSLSMGISRSNCVATNASISLFFMAGIPLCVCLFIEALLWGQHFGVQAPYIPCAPCRGSRGGSFCLLQLLGAPGGPGLVAVFLPSLPPSYCGFSSVSVSPLVSLTRTLFSDGGPPHPGGPPLRPFPWLLLCVISVVRILVSRLRAPPHPGGPGPWHTDPKTIAISSSLFSFS